VKKSRRFVSFIIFEIIFIPIVMLLLMYYGPFDNVRNTIVTTAMTTINHKYLATWFLSEEKINEIMNKNNQSDVNEKENLSAIKISSKIGKEIELIDIKKSKFTGKLLIVSDPSLIQVATTKMLGSSGQILSEIVSDYKAQAGVNAGGFADANLTGTGGIPTGIIMEAGKVKYCESDSEKFQIIGFNNQNILVISNAMTIKEVQDAGIRDAISFGPSLVINGKGTIKSGDGGWGIQPRTAIGQRQDGSVLLLCIDGRQTSSVGASLKEVQDILLEYGAYNAANLDGGSSTTMVAGGAVVNKPSDLLGERSIASAFIVKKG
jgi:exopolysaccharide biosynthesis protein